MVRQGMSNKKHRHPDYYRNRLAIFRRKVGCRVEEMGLDPDLVRNLSPRDFETLISSLAVLRSGASPVEGKS